MGTGFAVDLPEQDEGVVPRAVRHLFWQIRELTEAAVAHGLPPPEFDVKVCVCV
jgi:hypothetical protein